MKMNRFLSSWLNVDIYSMEKYIDFMELNFEATFKEIENRFKELQETPVDDPIREKVDYNQSFFDHLIDSTIEEHYEHRDFQRRYRYSVVIQLFIFFESEITKIINSYSYKDNEKLKGTFLERVRTIFHDKFNIKNFEEYNFIINFLELRNVLIHYNGRLYEENPKTKKKLIAILALNKFEGFNLIVTENVHSKKSYEVEIISEVFLKLSLKKIEGFLRELYKSIDNENT